MGERALTAAPPGRGVRPWMVLGVGIVAVSTGSILVRLAEAPPLAVGAWRLTLASVLLAPWAAGPVRREGPLLARREWLGVCLAGLALAVHFGTWIASLAYTTVASSVILVSTTPLFVGLASHYLLGERLSRRRTLAIAVALVGAAIVGYGDLAASGEALLGDLLALTGAVAMSAYLLLGR
ncbi:MAG: DMT family transporter, partial [Chloroflexi bacterium]|nr:DMT family transporter [Chloroflexota bacterium]